MASSILISGPLGTGDELSIVRDNDVFDVFHAVGIYGAPLHFLDNRITVEEPGRVPFSRHPGGAAIVPPVHTDCAGHVTAGNRIEGSTITGIKRRTPFPGVTWDRFSPPWESANGSAIWVSPGSDENEIVANTFEDIAGIAVVVKGANNHVALRSADDTVATRDPTIG